MKKLALALTLLVAAPGFAQIRIIFPVPPPLVVIEPGVQVVEDNDHEVFFVDNWYWYRQDGRWFRNQTHNGTWVAAEERVVPRTIVKFTPGHYRKFKGNKGGGHGDHHGGGAVIVNPPGPGKIKVKGGKGNKGH